MTPLIEFRAQIIFRLEEKKNHLERCFNQLDEGDMWWRPNEASNSVANIILHLAGNLGQYVLSSLGQQPDTRERDAEFDTRDGWTKELLLTLICTTLEQCVEVVQQCADEELLRERSVQGFSFTGIGVALHAVEHLSYHVGQIAYIVKLRKDRQVGLYDDFDLNQLNEG
ncbi:MAG: DUF1572 family protein [Bacteroidota bacterium]